MPKVPRITQSVATSGLPDVRISNAPVDYQGANRRLGAATETALKMGQDLAQQEKVKADRLSILTADRQLSEFETDLRYNEKTGYLKRTGKDAAGTIDDVGATWEQKVSELSEGLTSDQRAQFSESANGRWKSVNEGVQRHMFGERKKLYAQETESYVSNEMDAAVANYQDPERVNMSIERQRLAIESYGLDHGVDRESLIAQIQASESGTRAAVITRMIDNGNDLNAKAYYDSHKDAVKKQDRKQVERALKEGSTRGEARRQSDKILSKKLSRGDSLNLARSIKDTAISDMAVSRIKQRFADDEQDIQMQSVEIYDKMYSVVSKAGNIESVPPSQWDQLKPTHKAALKRLASGKDNETNLARFYELEQMAASPLLQDKFLTMHLPEEYGKRTLSNADFKKLSTLQANLRKKDGESVKQLDGITSKNQIITGTLREMDIDPSAKGNDDDVERTNLFRREVDRLVESRQRETGKKVTNTEVREIIEDLQIQVTTDKGWLWDTKKRLFELEPGEQASVDLSDIPIRERMKIESALRASNKSVTDDSITALYLRKLNANAN